MVKKKDKKNSPRETHESLVTALESIKGLLQKSDAKLSAARESIANASTQTEKGAQNVNDPNINNPEQMEIPVLDDIVIPAEDASRITHKIEETLSAIIPEALNELIPSETKSALTSDPEIMLQYLDTLQKNLEKAMRDSLMKSIVTIEVGLKKSLKSEIDKMRKQIKKDFS